MGSMFEQLGTQGALVVLGLLVLSLTFHEAAHAWAAWKLGDPTAKRLGRLTLNPLPHIDPVMTILVPVILAYTTGFIFGGARPVPVDPRNFANPHRSNALVALAGPLSNIFLAIVGLALLRTLTNTGAFDGKLMPAIFTYFVMFNVILAVFNAVPIPPLDGSRVVTWLLPPPLRAGYNALEGIGIFLIFGLLMFVPGARQLLWSVVSDCMHFLDRVVSLGGLW